jgi:hypothetical protein
MFGAIDLEARLAGSYTLACTMDHLSCGRLGLPGYACNLRVIKIENVMKKEYGTLGRRESLKDIEECDLNCRCKFRVVLR